MQAVQEIKTHYFKSSVVLKIDVAQISNVVYKVDRAEGWLVSAAEPVQVFKGGVPQKQPLLISGLGNQRRSIADASVFSLNQPVYDGDKCIVFLSKDPFLSSVTSRKIFRCNKIIRIVKE